MASARLRQAVLLSIEPEGLSQNIARQRVVDRPALLQRPDVPVIVQVIHAVRPVELKRRIGRRGMAVVKGHLRHGGRHESEMQDAVVRHIAVDQEAQVDAVRGIIALHGHVRKGKVAIAEHAQQSPPHAVDRREHILDPVVADGDMAETVARRLLPEIGGAKGDGKAAIRLGADNGVILHCDILEDTVVRRGRIEGEDDALPGALRVNHDVVCHADRIKEGTVAQGKEANGRGPACAIRHIPDDLRVRHKIQLELERAEGIMPDHDVVMRHRAFAEHKPIAVRLTHGTWVGIIDRVLLKHHVAGVIEAHPAVAEDVLVVNGEVPDSEMVHLVKGQDRQETTRGLAVLENARRAIAFEGDMREPCNIHIGQAIGTRGKIVGGKRAVGGNRRAQGRRVVGRAVTHETSRQDVDALLLSSPGPLHAAEEHQRDKQGYKRLPHTPPTSTRFMLLPIHMRHMPPHRGLTAPGDTYQRLPPQPPQLATMHRVA